MAARIARGRLFGQGGQLTDAAALTQALGGLKGPLMKVAQMMATIPDLLPPEYAEELQTLQSDAPPMGAAFVKRRMMAELGAGWRERYAEFDLQPAAAASLGQVHKATTTDGAPVACKLQYPDMQSAVEADLKQLDVLFTLHRQLSTAIDTREIKAEIGDRLREELDYAREAKNAALYADILADSARVRVPRIHGDLSTRRLLTLGWLDGRRSCSPSRTPTRRRATGSPRRCSRRGGPRWRAVRRDPWRPAPRQLLGLARWRGHARGHQPARQYGCIRIFPARFAAGVVELYRGFLADDEARIVHAYELWGFEGLTKDLIETR